MPSRKLKREASSSVSSSPLIHEDELKDEAPNSPKRGRKESEQKRRVLMNQYFDELIVLLTLLSQRHVPKKMDKVATLKEAIICLKVYHHLTNLGEPLPLPKESKSVIDRGDALKLVLNSQDSFMMMISDSGRIMYSNSLVTSLLGYTQTRLIGRNWYDYVHDKDKEMFQSLFTSSNGHQLPNSTVTSFPAQICTLHLQLYPGETGGPPQFLPFNCLVYLRKWGAAEASDENPLSPDENAADLVPLPDEQHYILLVGRLPTSLLHVDLPVATNDINFEFELRVSKQGRIISIEKHAILIIGFSSSELIGTSFFDYVDPYHLSDVADSISSLTKTGLGVTSPYRLMTKSGRYIWLISKTYTSYNPWINKPDHILFTNRILGSDQVLPEHRFYRSRKYLPEFELEQEYVISPSSVHTSPFPEKQLPPNLQQNPLVERLVSDPSSTLLGQDSQEMPFLPSHPMKIPLPLQQQQATRIMQAPQTSWMNPPGRQLEPSLPTFPTAPQMLPQGLVDIQKELERKNREIFEMQQRLLEQQKLFEAERNQFYQVSQQVLQCISAGSQPIATSESKFLAPTEVVKLPSNIPGSVNMPVSAVMDRSVSPVHGSNPSTPQSVPPQNPHGLYTQYVSQSGPPTPATPFSPFSPNSHMYSPGPSPAPSTPNVLQSASSVLQPPTPTSHLGMYGSSAGNNSFYPPQFPTQTDNTFSMHSTSSTQNNSSSPATSLAMHNNLVCDSLGLSNRHQLQQSFVSPVVSQIQTLSNLFGGH